MRENNEILKLSEVRKLVHNYEKEQLEFLVAELYKILTKSQKEQYNISDLIVNPDPEEKSPVKKKDISVRPFREIEEETDDFISNAYAQNYLIPNRIIPKNMRPKWRFVVKKIYKELKYYLQNTDYQLKATGLLEKLYEVMCYSCEFTLFNTYDSFDSIGIGQDEFFISVIEAFDQVLERETFADKGIDLIINNSLNRYTLYTGLMDIFIGYLKTPDMKYLFIEKCKSKWDFHHSKKADKKSVLSEYKLKNLLNNLAIMIFKGYMSLHEKENAVSHFKELYKDRDIEVNTYVLIDLLFHKGEKDWILKELNEAEIQKVGLRKKLIDLKEYIIKNDNLPPYIG